MMPSDDSIGRTGRRAPDRTIRPSVLDRLLDDESELAERALGWDASVGVLKRVVRRDLEWLLNTRRTPLPAPPHLRETARSLYHYGLPDVTALAKDSPDAHRQLRRWLEETIALFEPRLAGVRVTLRESEAGARREMRFLIEAALRCDEEAEPVAFDTVLEIASGAYEVRDGRHA
jgi:type VI secretion system protein ImpF